MKDKKYYYRDLAGVPFAKIYIKEKKLETLPKYWIELTEEEYKKAVKGA
jgi:hypothetical protein